MKKNLSDYLVALSVIACSLILLAALTVALSGYRLHKPGRTLQIKYEDVTGIKVNSEVRYAGAPAGRVIAMRHLTREERTKSSNQRDAVMVTVELEENIPPLPNDIVATLSSDTLLAPKFVALSAGTVGGKTLPNNAFIEGHPSYGIEELTAAAGPLLDNANHLLDTLNSTFTTLKSNLADFMPKISPLLDSLRLDVDQIQPAVKGLTDVESKADGVLGTADTFLGNTDTGLQAQLKELHVTLLNLKVITTHAKALVDALSEKPNRLIFSGKGAPLTPEEEIINSNKPLPARPR
jgi:ABC-type transporter Mla subunit MlaD